MKHLLLFTIILAVLSVCVPAPENTRAWVETRNRCLATHLPDLAITFVP